MAKQTNSSEEWRFLAEREAKYQLFLLQYYFMRFIKEKCLFFAYNYYRENQ